MRPGWAMGLLLATLSGCDREPQQAQPAAQTSSPSPAVRAVAAPDPAGGREALPTIARSEPPIARAVVLREWSRADNRADCVALAFSDDGGAGGAPRRAEFSGGWAVAFDLPGKRSAYGLAGTGLLPDDAASEEQQRQALARQWPLLRELPSLPQPAFAGYGAEGAQAYPAGDPEGMTVNSLAYVRVGDQKCLYNVWSRLGRAHLEALLDSLRVLGGTAG